MTRPPASGPRFRGIVPALASPLLDRESLDQTGLERLVEHVLAGGVHGLFILGATGEGPMLPHAVRRELVRRTLAQVASRVPVLVGITDTVFSESVALARFAVEHGATAVVAAAPYYFPAGREPMERWARTLARALPLPLVLSNMPEMVKMVLAADTILRLADEPNIVGLEDSGGNLGLFDGYARIVREQRPDWSLLIGSEQMLPQAHGLGGHGGVCGGGNIAPGLFVKLQAAIEARDDAAVAVLQGRVLSLGRLYGVGTQPCRVVVGIKNALHELGICGAACAGWAEMFNADQRDKVAEIMAEISAESMAF
jgi:dihydrodipicolinate synthase/N-acetylneuraminate lyase